MEECGAAATFDFPPMTDEYGAIIAFRSPTEYIDRKNRGRRERRCQKFHLGIRLAEVEQLAELTGDNPSVAAVLVTGTDNCKDGICTQ